MPDWNGYNNRTSSPSREAAMGEVGGHWPDRKPFRRREPPPSHSGITRRSLLATAALLITAAGVSARVVTKVLPWRPNEAYPVTPVVPGGYLFFTVDEAAIVDAFVDHLIPTDELGLGAKDAGVTTFIDRQLTGPYGGHEWVYMQGAFSPNPFARQGLAALEAYCNATFKRGFVALSADEKEKLIASMQKGEAKFEHFSSKMLFSAIYENTMEGYFADPIYGGNRDMAGWKLV